MDDLQARLARAVGERYLVERELGQGGMSHVFLAEDLKHGRKVAIKVLRPEFAQSLGTERFLREIRIAAQLSHPHILSLIDSGDADGLLYFVMFYSAGESLRERLTRERQLPIGDAIRFAQEIAEALAYAHEAGVVHRDIKPENILIEAGHAIVCDFGIARALTRAGGNELTQSGMVIGTPAYMSPEQTVGDAAVDPRTDIYSLGCVLYEMLSGDTPYMGSTPQVILARKAAEPVPSIRLVRDTVPSPVEATINRALARIPADRFSTAQEFADALSRAMTTGESPKLPAVIRQRRSQRLKAAGWLTVAVLSTVAVVAVMTSTRQTAPPLRTTFRQLTAQPGVEESPSLSPDGDWVIYSGVGDGSRDIFLLSVGGQNPINLTEGSPADDIQPVFSPDGGQIAFRSSRDGGGLFVMGRTGEAARRVTRSGFNPVWSPDGTHLAYATESVGIFPLNWEGVSELWSVDVNSGQLERLSQSDAVQPSWSPHGKRIAFARRIGTPVQMNIATMPADGGEPVALTETAATDWSPTWSPEGDFIYFSSDRGGSMNLWRVRVDEESGRALAEPEPVTTPSPFVAHPSLASQGKLLAFASVLTTQNVQRASIDLSTGAIIDLFWVTTGSRQWSSPEPSPDGEWIVFYSRDRPEGDLYVVRKDGTGLRQVTSGTVLDRMPRWSPDGVWLAYFSTRSGTLQQWMIRADGSGNRQLTDFGSGGVGFGAWSPDGSRLAVNSVGSARETYVFDPHRAWDEQTPEVLATPDSSLGDFTVNSWSPDGRYLAGFVGPLSDLGIVIYSLDSGEYEQLTDYGQWPVWLGDSHHLLFVSGGKDFFVIDTQTREVQKVFSVTGDVLGPAGIASDGRQIAYTRRVTESDIWLVTLR